jgi:hypothetical protein
MTKVAIDPAGDVPPARCQGRVRVPDGRIGDVVGYYRQLGTESVFVSFSTSTTEDFLNTEVVPIG